MGGQLIALTRRDPRITRNDAVAAQKQQPPAIAMTVRWHHLEIPTGARHESYRWYSGRRCDPHRTFHWRTSLAQCMVEQMAQQGSLGWMRCRKR
jgi:hypothetical protein